MCAKFPGTRVLFVSGYAESVVVHQGVLEEAVELIEKLFASLDLLRKVRELLDRPVRFLRLRLHVTYHPVDAELVRQISIIPEELVFHGMGGLSSRGELGVEGVSLLLAAALDPH